MSNDYYTPSGAPGTNAQLSSAQIRAEFELLQQAFNLLPTPSRLNSGATNAAVTTGAADVYSASIASVTEYQDMQRYTLKINATNTGASTINISGLGARSVKRLDGSDLEEGDLIAGLIYDFVYDATTGFIMLMTLMPNTIQSQFPTFQQVQAMILTALTSIKAPSYETNITDVSIDAGVATVPWGGIVNISVTSDFTITFEDFPTTAGSSMTLIFANTGAFNCTGLTASGMTIKRPNDVPLTLTSGSGKIDVYTVLVYKTDQILVFPVKNFVALS